MKSTRAPSSSRGVQWGLSEMPDVATQAHRGPRSQGSDHGSKSQRAGTEKRAGERLLPSRSNSTRKGTHHVVKRPDQAGRRGPARGPTHLHPTRDTSVNPTTTRSYVEVVRGVAQRSGRPATVRGPPHVTRYILLPRAPTHPPQPPSAQQRHEGEGRGFVLRSPKDGLSAGTWRRKVVMCPRRGNDPASGHPRAHQPPLGRGTSPPAWDGRLDAPGQRRRHLPSSAWTRRREVKQGKSGGSVGTTDQGKGKGRSVVRPMGTVAYRGKGQGKGKGRGEGRLGQGGRGRSKGGEKLMGTTAYGGKGSKGRAANGDRPVGAASCRRDHHTMASCQNPPPLRGFGMTPWCDDLVCSWRRLLADRHSLPFPWTLSLHRRWCPSASHHPLTFLFLLALTFPLPSPFPSLGLSLCRAPCPSASPHSFPSLSLGRLCQRSPRTCPVSLLCVESTQRKANAFAVGQVRPSSHPKPAVRYLSPTAAGGPWDGYLRGRFPDGGT